MTNIKDLENRLWEAANHMRANSPLRLSEFAEPVLGLIFLKFAGVKHNKVAKELAEEKTKKTKSHGGASVSRERPTSSADYHARGVLYVPEKARFSYLIELPEGTDMGKAVNDAMKVIESENKELAGILPKTFQKLDNRTIIALLKNFNQIRTILRVMRLAGFMSIFLVNLLLRKVKKEVNFLRQLASSS